MAEYEKNPRACKLCRSPLAGAYIAVKTRRAGTKAVCESCVNNLALAARMSEGHVRMVPGFEGPVTYEPRLRHPPIAMYREEGSRIRVKVLHDSTDVDGQRTVQLRALEIMCGSSGPPLPIGHEWTSRASSNWTSFWSLEYL